MSLRLLDRAVSFQRCFVTITGSVNAALMLSQAVYWHLRTADPDGWFYKSQSEWEEETGLSRYEQEGARKRLQSLGFWEERREGMPAKLYFRLDEKKLQKQIDGLAQSSMRKTRILDAVKPANKNGEKPQTIKEHDITTEITTERGEGLDLTGKQKPAARNLKAAPFFEPDPAEKQVEAYTAVEQAILSVCGMKKPSNWRDSDKLAAQASILKAEGVTPEEIRAIVAAKPERVIPLGFFAERLLAERAAKQRGMSAPYVQHAPRSACKANGGCDGSGWITFPDERGIEKCVCYA